MPRARRPAALTGLESSGVPRLISLAAPKQQHGRVQLTFALPYAPGRQRNFIVKSREKARRPEIRKASRSGQGEASRRFVGMISRTRRRPNRAHPCSGSRGQNYVLYVVVRLYRIQLFRSAARRMYLLMPGNAGTGRPAKGEPLLRPHKWPAPHGAFVIVGGAVISSKF